MKVAKSILLIFFQLFAGIGTLSAHYIAQPVQLKPIYFVEIPRSKLGLSTKVKYKYNWTGFFSINKSTFKNWQEEAENNLNLFANFEPRLNCKSKNFELEQKLKIQYGYSQLNWKDSKKTADVISTQSKWKLLLNKYTSCLFQIKIQTQLTNTYKLKETKSGIRKIQTSNFLSPGYLTMMGGINFDLPPDLSIDLGLHALKITTLYNQNLYRINEKDELFNVAIGKKSQLEFGFAFQLEYKKNILKNIDFSYSNKAFANKNNLESIDIESKLEINLKVNKHIKTMLIHHLIYDQDIIYRSQIQQQFIVGYYF